MRVIPIIFLLASKWLFLHFYYRIPRDESEEECFESEEVNSDVDEELVPLDFVLLLDMFIL